jgi:hypothetical protein
MITRGPRRSPGGVLPPVASQGLSRCSPASAKHFRVFPCLAKKPGRLCLIHTCQLCGANSFDYLVELQRHARELAACPAEWMPWKYRETLARTVSHPDPT